LIALRSYTKAEEEASEGAQLCKILVIQKVTSELQMFESLLVGKYKFPEQAQ